MRIALAGNPNSGKTTLFNALTGAHHKVGNYPGVTVEKKEGTRKRDGKEYHFIDLPGVYSLTAYSVDEVVTRDFILDEKPDIIVDVLDSTSLERNLYLCLQFQELGIPVVGALNMSDEALAKGIHIDEKVLSKTLGIPLVKTVGLRSEGIEKLLDCLDSIDEAAKTAKLSAHSIHYGNEIEAKLHILEDRIAQDTNFAARYPSRWLAVKLLEKDSDAFKRLTEHANASAIESCAKEAAIWVGEHFGKDAEIIVGEQRYGYIRGALREAIRLVKKVDFSLTEKIDAVVMNRFLALPIFFAVLWAMFQVTFIVGQYPMAALEVFFSFLGNSITVIMGESLLQSLIVDGIIAGVGGVLSFVPLIVILFFILSTLEDVGYMSRAAFATDKFLHLFGLHGQSIFPMILGFGCSVPAIMASRTLKSPRDRILTVLVTPLMSCGAKLPVYVLLAGTFFPSNAANVITLMYLIGAALSLVCSLLLKRTVLRREPTPFIMELPPYRAPTLKGLIWHVWEKSWSYIRRAGTVILAASILIWLIITFPITNTENTSSASSEYQALSTSYAGRIGRFLEPAFRPLGFDWRIAVATLTGMAAKEITVSTMGVLYRVGSAETEGSLRQALKADPDWTPLTAITLMLFTLIIPPCLATLATIRTEIGTKWLLFEIAFLLSLGWIMCFAVYRIGSIGTA